MNFRASPVFFEQAASLLQSLQSMNNLFGSQPGSSISSSESAFKTSKSVFSKSTTQSEEDDCEIIFYEPVKKLKSGESTINLAEDCSSVHSYGKKISQSNLLSPQKSLSPSTQPDNSNSVERKSSSNFIESLSGYNSSSEPLAEKDAMELDDDDLPYEQLIMEDDVTKELRKSREQVEKMTQKGSSNDELKQASLLAAQQRYQMQLLSSPNYMQSQMVAMLYNAKMNYLRQMQAQASAQIQAQTLSLLGKRLYEQFEGVQSRNNYIVLDDEQSYENEQMERVVEEKLKSGQKNIFKITKEVRKKVPKKVFTIIRQKPRVHRKIVIPRRMSLMESINPIPTTATEKVQPKKIQTEQIPKKDEKLVVEVPKKRKEVKKDNDDEYVIKLHVNENDDNEDINETPVGEEFQVKVGAFKGNQRVKKELKLVWDPSKATERNVNSYFQKLETKFGKKIVSEEFALKFYYEHKMNVKKIMAEIEGNKMYFKNFFEMKQKVLRNRVLHNDL